MYGELRCGEPSVRVISSQDSAAGLPPGSAPSCADYGSRLGSRNAGLPSSSGCPRTATWGTTNGAARVPPLTSPPPAPRPPPPTPTTPTPPPPPPTSTH